MTGIFSRPWHLSPSVPLRLRWRSFGERAAIRIGRIGCGLLLNHEYVRKLGPGSMQHECVNCGRLTTGWAWDVVRRPTKSLPNSTPTTPSFRK